eukprot:SAG31_NODE_940_length_10870_cov_12.600501_6_plen_43_part_00
MDTPHTSVQICAKTCSVYANRFEEHGTEVKETVEVSDAHFFF